MCSIKLILDFKNRVYFLLVFNGALLITYPEQAEKITIVVLFRMNFKRALFSSYYSID